MDSETFYFVALRSSHNLYFKEGFIYERNVLPEYTPDIPSSSIKFELDSKGNHWNRYAVAYFRVATAMEIIHYRRNGKPVKSREYKASGKLDKGIRAAILTMKAEIGL